MKSGTFNPLRFSQAARWVERTYDLQKKSELLQKEVEQILHEAETLLRNSSPAEQLKAELKNDGSSEGGSSFGSKGKARGRECRAVYISQQAKDGNLLERVRGVLYRKDNGLIVGIAYAKMRKNEWFLGLPAGEFQEAVLLCEENAGILQPIHLTEAFVEKYKNRLSVSSQYNQSKFVVQRRGGRYNLVVSGVGDVDLTAFLVDESFVCPTEMYV